MPRLCRLLALGALCAVIFAFALPSAAQAQSATTVQDQCADGSMNKGFQSAFGQAGQAKIQAANAVLGLFGAVDIKARYCLNKITQMFSALGSLSDPLALIWNIVSQQIMQFINQLCSVALNAASQLKQFVTSQLNQICIPMPNLGLGIGGLKLNLPLGQPCTGIPLLQAAGVNGVSAAPIIDWKQLLPRSSQ